MKTEIKLNREAWLNKATDLINNHYAKKGYSLEDIRSEIMISCGYPPNTRTGSKNTTFGVHINPLASESGKHEIFLNPIMANSLEVIDVLAHELVHAIQTHLFPKCKKAHGKEFIKICKAVDMTGSKKFAQAEASEDFKKDLNDIIHKIGEYPHSAINLNAKRKKQSTRNIKVECSNCSYSYRTSKTNILSMTNTTCNACGESSLTAELED